MKLRYTLNHKHTSTPPYTYIWTGTHASMYDVIIHAYAYISMYVYTHIGIYMSMYMYVGVCVCILMNMYKLIRILYIYV